MVANESELRAAVIRKAAWRLLPFMGLLYFVSFLDRVNVSFAALTMNADIGLSSAAFGLGAGIFFIGYLLFEIPSNLILSRVGARRWIARIMITWGLLSASMALVNGPVSFYVLRFLLGVAEAGFFPGMILYLTYWFPAEVRARVIGSFLVAVPLSTVVGAPLSTALLETSLFGLKGWQTMFILEGLPAILLGVAALFVLTDRPGVAKWLSPAERETIEGVLAQDGAHADHLSGLRQGLLSPRVWLLGLVYFGLVLGVYGLGFWAPQIIKSAGALDNRQTGILTAVPYAFAAAAMIYWSLRSDRTRERIRHVALPAFAAAIGFLVSAYTANPWLALAALTLGAVGVFAALAVFWTLPTSMLSGAAAAGGIALINSIGNLGGYLGPYAIGALKQHTGGYGAGMVMLAAAVVAAGVLVRLIGSGAKAALPLATPVRVQES
jgi:MFS transporter, ACS family, tartrate transporter